MATPSLPTHTPCRVAGPLRKRLLVPAAIVAGSAWATLACTSGNASALPTPVHVTGLELIPQALPDVAAGTAPELIVSELRAFLAPLATNDLLLQVHLTGATDLMNAQKGAHLLAPIAGLGGFVDRDSWLDDLSFAVKAPLFLQAHTEHLETLRGILSLPDAGNREMRFERDLATDSTYGTTFSEVSTLLSRGEETPATRELASFARVAKSHWGLEPREQGELIAFDVRFSMGVLTLTADPRDAKATLEVATLLAEFQPDHVQKLIAVALSLLGDEKAALQSFRAASTTSLAPFVKPRIRVKSSLAPTQVTALSPAGVLQVSVVHDGRANGTPYVVPITLDALQDSTDAGVVGPRSPLASTEYITVAPSSTSTWTWTGRVAPEAWSALRDALSTGALSCVIVLRTDTGVSLKSPATYVTQRAVLDADEANRVLSEAP